MGLGSSKNLHVVDTVLVKYANLLIQSLDFIKIGWLGKTLSGGLFSRHQPGGEFLDTSSVFSPELDIVGVFVALNLGVSLKVSHILGDSGKLVLECLGISRDLVSLWQKSGLYISVGLKDFNLPCNILLEVHGSCNSILREHASRSRLDIIKLSSGRLHPAVNGLQGVIEACKRSNKLFNFGNSLLEAAVNHKFFLNSLHLLGKNLLLVLGNGNCHASVVGIDGRKESIDGIIALVDFFLSNFKFSGNGFIVLGITDESFLGLIEE